MSTAHARMNNEAGSSLNQGRTPVLRLIAGGIAFTAVVLLLLWHFDAHQSLLHLLAWIDQQGAWAAVLFIALMAVVVILLLPGVVFTTGAGFVFGILPGTLYVVVGTTIGAALAFLIARFLFGERARRAILANRKLQAISLETAQSGFQFVLMTRLIPFFPFKLSNYLFGLTEISFGRYAMATLIGCIPFSLNNVYLGSMASDIARIGAGELTRTPLQWGVYGLGFIVTVVALVYINRLAQRGLARYRSDLTKE